MNLDGIVYKKGPPRFM